MKRQLGLLLTGVAIGISAPQIATGTNGGSVDPGTTVLLKKQTKTSDCTLGSNPDRHCSPGAYYSKLTKAVICSASFRTGPIRNVPQSEKYAVETEYGIAVEALRSYAGDRPHHLARARWLKRHREPLPGASKSSPRLQGQGQARKQAPRPGLFGADDPQQRSGRDRYELAEALSEGVRNGARRLAARQPSRYVTEGLSARRSRARKVGWLGRL